MLKLFLTKWPFLFKLRLFFILLGLIIVLIFLYLKVVPGGHIIYERDYEQDLRSGKGFILGFTPAERANLSGAYPKMIGDPVYFSLFTPRTFDTAKVTITYRDHLSSSTPLIEMGVLKDKIVRNYALQPMENKILNGLAELWTKTTTDGVTFLQATKNYPDLTAFKNDLADGHLKSCPNGPTACVAVYNYSLAYNYQMADASDSQPLIINQPLRGAHQFYVYVPAGDLRLDFNFVDLNQDKGQDPITVNLYYGDKLIDHQYQPDSNPSPMSGVAEQKKLFLSESNLKPGVYKAEIKISDDVVIKKIQSSSDRLSFINKVWPVSSSGNLTLYTDADYLQAKAFTPASLQTINFNGQDFNLDQPYQQFEFTASTQAVTALASVAAAPIKVIKLVKDDVILENNGVFSWSPDSLFNPAFKKVDGHLNLNGIKYIVAVYQAPLEQNSWSSATAAFSLADSYREDGKYSFLLSVPGLKAERGDVNYLEIKSIRVELSGRTLWQKLKSFYGQN